ncbi:hypothetical protein BCR43DRAFT_489144 [Syncephalastrum racemosum]|uniref:DUF2470 domain-containing protein n=1 Tax=Syncephalastrum racemosum TaxID=13706 RepID=A0A1X2HJT1_SYNRA|nr:hypothetical protein BCR43DRAFT_489144 [Syncephalastrum racemosum]
MPNDPIAPHSAPIAAYMSAHTATNLAYVKYFGEQPDAISATFKSLDSQGFKLDYTLEDGSQGECFIPFKTPLAKREDIRPVLENMAKEAETALGLPSSLAGPPPLKAIAKAMYAGVTDLYTPPNPSVPLDAFYPVPGVGVAGGCALFGALALAAYYPGLLKSQGQQNARLVIRGIAGIHIVEGLATVFICLRRGWYSPKNTIKWTLQTLLFGFGSLRQLKRHAAHVRAS